MTHVCFLDLVEVVSSAQRVDHNCSNITHCCATHCHVPLCGKMSGNIRARSFRMSVFVDANFKFFISIEVSASSFAWIRSHGETE